MPSSKQRRKEWRLTQYTQLVSIQMFSGFPVAIDAASQLSSYPLTQIFRSVLKTMN